MKGEPGRTKERDISVPIAFIGHIEDPEKDKIKEDTKDQVMQENVNMIDLRHQFVSSQPIIEGILRSDNGPHCTLISWVNAYCFMIHKEFGNVLNIPDPGIVDYSMAIVKIESIVEMIGIGYDEQQSEERSEDYQFPIFFHNEQLNRSASF